MRELRGAVAAVVAAVVLASAPTAGADTGGDEALRNRAVAVNTATGSRLVDLSFSVEYVATSALHAENLAVAVTQCDGCESAAVAIQIVLSRGAADIDASNVATALNEGCDSCDSLARAVQFVLDGEDGIPAHLERRLQRVNHHLLAVERGNPSLRLIERRVDHVIERLTYIIERYLAER